jgi:hypothetical protein
LADLGAAYEERPGENPYLNQFLAGGTLDAIENQHWFLDRISEFLSLITAPIAVIDQSPLGVAAYSRLYCEHGLFPTDAVEDIETSAHNIVGTLEKASVRLLHVVLTASTATLWNRLSASGRSHLPQVLVSRVNELFQSIVYSHACLPINSEVLTIDDEAAQVRRWVQRSLSA